MNTTENRFYHTKPSGELSTLTIPWPSQSDLVIDVRVINTRVSYGRTDLLVEPVAGKGRVWVSKGKVKAKKAKREPKEKAPPTPIPDAIDL